MQILASMPRLGQSIPVLKIKESTFVPMFQSSKKEAAITFVLGMPRFEAMLVGAQMMFRPQPGWHKHPESLI